MMRRTMKRSRAAWWVLVGIVGAVMSGAVGLASEHVESARYVAGHGFSEPLRLATPSTTTRVGLASEDGTPWVYWYDATGVYREALVDGSPEERLSEARGTRDLSAVTVAGTPAVATAVRDFATGLHAHTVQWRGETRTLASSLQVRSVRLAAAEDGPIWAIREPSDLGSSLVVGGWVDETTTVRQTDESIAGYDLVAGPDGMRWVSWLEGSTDQTALGTFSDWRAYVARVDAEGAAGIPLELGAAAQRGRLDLIRLTLSEDGRLHVVWPREDGTLVASVVATDRAEGSNELPRGVVEAEYELGTGIATGVFDGFAYWADGDRILRKRLEPGSGIQQVLWSPNAVEALAADRTASGDLFLTWYGGTLRGGYAVFGAGTHDPFEPGWEDLLAAAMGWNPWDLWSEALGQFLTSALVGVLATMAMSPILWLLSALLIRFGSFERFAALGVGVGTIVVASIWLTLRVTASLPEATVASLFGTVSQVAAALALGGAVTWLARRRADTEPLLGTLVAAASSSGIAIAILCFITFQAWSESWRGIL